MCGIVGAIGNLQTSHARFFDQMVFIDTIRGPHSTGLVSVDTRKQEASMYHTMNPGHLAVAENRWKSSRSVWNAAWIGHNRYATHGAVNLQNAHPFSHGDITGVHNGSLEWGWEYDFHTLNAPTFGTDSETIFWAIDQYGIDEALKYCDGAYALVWYDANENSMNFITNGQRPLHYATTYDGSAMYFSSLEEIMWTLEAQGKGNAYCLRNSVAFKPDVLHTLYLPEKVTDISFKPDKWAFETREIKGGEEVKGKSYTHTTSTSTNKEDDKFDKWQEQFDKYNEDKGTEGKKFQPTVILGGKGEGTKSLSSSTQSVDPMTCYARFLKRNHQRLKNESYVKFVMDGAPTDKESYDALSGSFAVLKSNTMIMYPPEQVPNFNLKRMESYVNRLRDITMIEDKLQVYEGTFDYWSTDAEDKDSFRLTVQTTPCFNCGATDMFHNPDNCAELVEEQGYLCPDCADLPVFSHYIVQNKA